MEPTRPVNTNDFVLLHQDDNVVVALRELCMDDRVAGVTALEPIPMGHKMAIHSIEAGEAVRKYGFPIGIATRDIRVGQHVHEHNCRTVLGASQFASWSAPHVGPEPISKTDFLGFECSPDRVAARNEIWIVNTVACVNQTATRLADRANRQLLDQFPNVDGFYCFPHPFGCSQLGDDLNNTKNVLAGLINHPHAGGALVLGLGCENNQMEAQIQAVAPNKLARVEFFNTQDVADEMEDGLAALSRLASQANAETRVAVPTDRLVLGMKCGGSDGFSGITANPLLGRIADRHCRAGGTVLLTEVPEMFGAESVLLARCATQAVYDELCQTIDAFKNYFRSHNQPISENPSPGNRDGGITTLEEKSLGCVQKGGIHSLVKEVVPYGSMASTQLGGIAIVNGPGNDGVSTTALTTAGANIVLFTTGRGTPLGAPVPTLKIATNTSLADRKPSWIDFDAGQVLTGDKSMDSLADELYELILSTASGEYQARNEENGYREIAIWKTGVTL